MTGKVEVVCVSEKEGEIMDDADYLVALFELIIFWVAAELFADFLSLGWPRLT